jgi:hypothetical protein
MLVGGIADSGGCLITETARPTERYTSLAAFERSVAHAAADLLGAGKGRSNAAA